MIKPATTSKIEFRKYWLLYFCRQFGKRRFIRRSIRYRLFMKIKSSKKFKIKYFDLNYHGSLDSFIDRSVFYFGGHELEILKFSKKFLSPNLDVIDVGANVGTHTLFYSRHSHKVFAIEPSKTFLSAMVKQIESNNIKNVEVVQYGIINDKPKTLTYFEPTGDNKGVGSFIKNYSKAEVRKTRIKVTNGISLAKKYDFSKVNFIKIDVEGYDYQVVLSFRNLIKENLPVIQIEYNPRDAKKFIQMLSRFREYKPFFIRVNNPFFLFNNPFGKLIAFKPEKRGEVFLIPKKYLD